MYQLRRKLLSQNFLHSRKLVSQLLGNSAIGKHDLVLEIGPGKGIITEQLLEKSGHVIGVELDSYWYTYLQTKFQTRQNLTLYQQDFLNFKLPSLPYKVFANIPFSIEGKIIRKLIDDTNPPTDCYLVMMKEVAYRLAAPYKDNMFSIQHKPWFNFSIYHHFRATDFEPIPRVEIVMLRFWQRRDPLLSWDERTQYQRFIEKGFHNGRLVKDNFKQLYGKQKVQKAMGRLNLPRDIKPSHLTLQQWLQLYKTLNT